MSSAETMTAGNPGYIPLGAMTLEEGTALDGATGEHHWRFVAADESGARVDVTLLAMDLLRVRLLPPGVEPAPSWAVARDEWPAVEARVEWGENGTLRLTTDAMRVEIAPDPFRITCSWPDGAPFAEDDATLGMGYVRAPDANTPISATLPLGSLRCHKRLAQDERILGAGERTGSINTRGAEMTFWNTDPPMTHGPETGAMYASIPFWLGLRGGRAYGVFLDSAWRSDLDAGATRDDILSFGPAGGDLTYYLFAGPTPAAVLTRYADLTGHMPMPPRWALGYGQSRWSYFPDEELREIASQMRQRGIPCDSLWLDIDYMDGYRVFTWSPQRFPAPAELLRELASQGFKVVTIIDPGVKVDPTDPTYSEGLERDYFVRRPDGSLFTGSVWPGESAFPDFSRADVRAWWGERHKALLDVGVAAVWDDMNEPSLTSFLAPEMDTPHGTTLPSDVVHHPEGPDGPALPHAAFHNAYGMQMARATFEGQARLRPHTRPFVLTRSGYAGVQRYAALWTGDNTSRWDHLALAARMSLSLGLSGVPFVGFDTGGFWENSNGELLTRFTQLGALFPFFRNHSAMGTSNQEPWGFGQPYEAFCRTAIELRYRLLPYLYTAFADAHREGTPITRPLVYAFPDDETLSDVEDEALVGDALLAAPVIEEGAILREVRFPRGVWIDWLNGQRFIGPLRERVEASIDILPLYAREGAIVSLGPVMNYVGERTDDPITLATYLGPDEGAEAHGKLYEDDGETPAYQQGNARMTTFNARRTVEGIRFTADEPEGEYDGAPHEWIVELHLPFNAGDARPTASAARLNDQALDPAAIEAVERRYETLLRVALGQVAAPFTLEVSLT